MDCDGKVVSPVLAYCIITAFTAKELWLMVIPAATVVAGILLNVSKTQSSAKSGKEGRGRHSHVLYDSSLLITLHKRNRGGLEG